MASTQLTEQLSTCLAQQEQAPTILESLRTNLSARDRHDLYPTACQIASKAIHELETHAVLLETRLDAGEGIGACQSASHSFDMLKIFDEHLDTLLQLMADPEKCKEVENLGIFHFLVEYSFIDPSVHEHCILINACVHGDVQLLDLLLKDPRVNPAAIQNLAIRSASRNGHLAVVDRLLREPRVDPAAMGNYAFLWACECGHLPVVNRLLEEPRVDPSAERSVAIIRASKYNMLDVVERLLQEPRIDPWTYNCAALELAIKNNHTPIIQLFLEYDGPRGALSSENFPLTLIAALKTENQIALKMLLQDSRATPLAVQTAISRAGWLSKTDRQTMITRCLSV